ncbi:MAG: S24/S26 family peptidase [Opitutae bacterium]|nr:S24/S26 family peptidase [Opitutae bacterium]
MSAFSPARFGNIFLPGLTLAFASCLPAAEPDEPWIRGIYTGRSPRAVTVGEREAWQRASEIARRTPHAFVLVGEGESMEPLYRPGTVLVLQKSAYTALQRGQTVFYLNREKRTVAHVLVAKARDGWRAAGLNNREHDMEPVVAQNLVGVVIAAFAPQTGARTFRTAAHPRQLPPSPALARP